MAYNMRVQKILEILFIPEDTEEIFIEALPAGLDDTVLISNLKHSLSEV